MSHSSKDKYVGNVVLQSKLPMLDDDGLIPNEPVYIIGRRMVKKDNVVVTKVLVQWHNSFLGDATWEPYKFSESFSSLQSLRTMILFNGGVLI